MEEFQIKKDPERLNILKKIDDYEKEGLFDKDVENDPPSVVLMPNKVDYLNRKLKSKICTKISNISARKFLNKLLKEKKLIIKDIIGIENWANINSGAIITCNHFNAFDSFAMQVVFDRVNKKKHKLYKIIREGNYTGFEGFYGFLMRHCNTLPLSSNKDTMSKFINATDTILKRGDYILVYPEQSMWWNYRKPKPLKKGAFNIAVRNNVPVVPCFITMSDSKVIGNDGFPIQEYTIFIEKPIFPDISLSKPMQIERLKEENYSIWKSRYESFYGIPLLYLKKKAA